MNMKSELQERLLAIVIAAVALVALFLLFPDKDHESHNGEYPACWYEQNDQMPPDEQGRQLEYICNAAGEAYYFPSGK